MTRALNTRWRAVLEMQQRLKTLNPGSPEAEILEHAVSLAINSKSQEENLKFFRYDIIRNAKFSIQRTKIRQRRLCRKVALLTPTWNEEVKLYASSDLEAQLSMVIAASGKNMSKCFEDMINGKSVAATALACGVSQRTANRLRQKVRQIVQIYLDSQEPA
ncbi:MAG: hypothetical protein KME32_00880 [Mojavia pulchra JT2-VF2]|jgi:hypothetical protein|uniref:Uncharacterized protein n=1 Tax=Mojavia pulchra JT2-VF2 TaxID=287848 RepID=A0A951PTQ5_9NOST|nr:hypothetical protein [Mojavia pulchra JT2-VF2]